MKILTKTKTKKIYTLLFVVVLLEFVIMPLPGLAFESSRSYLSNGEAAEMNDKAKASNIEFTFDELSGNFSLEYKLDILGNIYAGDYNDVPLNHLPKNKPVPGEQIGKTLKVEMTAYNSDISQCDGSPCITANGYNVCRGGKQDTVAANFLPFGTKIRIPEFFGEQVFIVRDRMNSRYQTRVDVWMRSYQDAINFGRRFATIEIVP
jgi:3D (Asp-Asp-Asp) domain-containing protein